MHVLAMPLFRNATGVAVALTAWARHRCLQLYLGPEHRWCEDPLESALFIRAQASKAQGPLVLLRIIIYFLFIFFLSTVQGFLGALTCSKALENSHTRWNPRSSGRCRGWDPGMAQGLYGAP